MKTRTKEEIQKQIDGLKAMKKWFPHHSVFGDNNHAGIEVQLDILEGKSFASDYEEFSEDNHWFPEEDLEYVRERAEEAEQWLNGESDEDLFDTK